MPATTSNQSPFTTHEIVSRVEVDSFGTWLMRRRRKDGSLDGTFWVRVMAADGLLTVVGDFDPTVFAYGPADPAAAVRWIGRKSSDDTYYPVQKAAIGMGDRDKVTEWDTDLAREQLQAMLAEAKAEREAAGDADESKVEQAIQDGIDASDDYSGRVGVDVMIMAVLDGGYVEAEDVGDIGRRPAPSVELAVQALNQLVKLLDAEVEASEAGVDRD